MSAIKVLFCGQVHNNFDAAIKKINAVNQKSGPFDVAFIAGPAVSAASSPPSVKPAPGLKLYCLGNDPSGLLLESHGVICLGRSGVAQVAGLNVAFLDVGAGPQPPGSSSLDPEVAAVRQALNSLEGEVDVMLTSQWPLGIYDGCPAGMGPEGLDIPPAGSPQAPGSLAVAQVAVYARPRYLVAGGQEVQFVRLPYVNPDVGVGVRVTRFVGLAPLSSKAKNLHALSLVPSGIMDVDALSARPEGCTTSPLEGASSRAAVAAAAAQRGKRGMQEDLPNAGDWRWQQPGAKRQRSERPAPQPIAGRGLPQDHSRSVIMRNVPWHATEEDVVAFFAEVGQVEDVWRGLNPEGKLNSWMRVQLTTPEGAERAVERLSGREVQGRQVTIEMARPREPSQRAPVGGEGCWFCLGSSTVDVGLIASVGEECYVAVDKGPITPTHVLLVPIDHAPCSAVLPAAAFAEFERYLSALSTCFAARGLALVAFERFLTLRKSGAGGNHCHINAIGVPASEAKRAEEVFQAAARAAGAELTELDLGPSGRSNPEACQAALRAAVSAPGPSGRAGHPGEYFMAVLPDGRRLLHTIQKGERWPLNLGREVLAELVGAPSRANWKECTASPEEEVAVTERFKEDFKQYDPTAQ